MNTIRRGSSGADVIKWQNIIGVTADGKFGPGTEAKTKEWQTANKLVPDGIVGPNTWGAATGTGLGNIILFPKKAERKKTPSAGADKAAYEIALRAEPTLSEQERQYALTVARGEGFYGKGWKGPGVGSKNWGAVQGAGPAGSFQNVDHHADGSSYIGKFKRYNSDEEGFADMARVLFKGGKRGAKGSKAIKDALARGSLRDAVFAQHANGYFELHPEKYLTAVLLNYNTLTGNIEWKEILSQKGRFFAPVIKLYQTVRDMVAS
jgi:hypothetical protein